MITESTHWRFKAHHLPNNRSDAAIGSAPLEYRRRVERANVGGAEKYQLISMSQLVNVPVQKSLARRFFNNSSVTQQQLDFAFEAHAGYGGAEDDSQGCLPEWEADARLAEVPPKQRVAVDTPCMLEAVGACDPRPAGTTSEPLVREADSPDGVMPSGGVAFGDGVVRKADISDDDVERYQVPEDNGVLPSGGVDFGDCVDVPVPSLVSPAQTAAYLPQWFGGGIPLDGVLSCILEMPGVAELPQWFGRGIPMDGVLSGTMEVPGGAGLEEQGATV